VIFRRELPSGLIAWLIVVVGGCDCEPNPVVTTEDRATPAATFAPAAPAPVPEPERETSETGRDRSLTLAGPDGAVLLVSASHGRVTLKECERLSIVDVPDDCDLAAGAHVSEVDGAPTAERLRAPLAAHGVLAASPLPSTPAAAASALGDASTLLHSGALRGRIHSFLKFYCKSLQADDECNRATGGAYLSLLATLAPPNDEEMAPPLHASPSRPVARARAPEVTSSPMLHFVNGSVSVETIAHMLRGDGAPLVSVTNFVPVPAGSFTMGSASDETDRYENEARVRVTLSRPFEMQTAPVTQLQWYSVMGTTPSTFASKQYCPDPGDSLEVGGHFLCTRFPVESVSWQEVADFVRQLNVQAPEHVYRLPTEAEREYAARAGRTGRFSFGDEEATLGDHAWFKGNAAGQTHEVCTTRVRTNPWGFCDVEGNVWEWVSDWYSIGRAGGVDVAGPATGTDHVFRGGAWNSEASLLRAAARDRGVSATRGFVDYRASFVGFRLVRESRASHATRGATGGR